MAEFSARRSAAKDFGAALLWADRAAEQGSARGAFDAAYYRQFGLGAPQASREQTEARYWRLFRTAPRGDWAPRVAALAGLGLERVRSFFLAAQELWRTWWPLAPGAAPPAVPASARYMRRGRLLYTRTPV